MGAKWVHEMAKRTRKGEIAIADRNGWIRLRWRHQGKRYDIALGLRHDQVNYQVAEQRASQIRLDILSGNFDSTLAKYKGDRLKSGQNVGAVTLFERYTDWKAKRLESSTLEKYRGLLTWLREHFGDRPATEADTEPFINWLLENLEAITVHDRLSILKACWNWGVEQEMVKGNPWSELTVRKMPTQKEKAFTRDEVERIIQGFENSRYYRRYLDFVRFKFNTGCRTGEAVALKWKHFNADCSAVWIGESFTKGKLKPPKNGKSRQVRLGRVVSVMLRSRMTDSTEGDDLMFPAPRGGIIDAENFADRGWAKILAAADVPYRKPYNTRHTFVSHCLERGMNPVEVAAITGHDVRTLYRDYAGLIKSSPQAPDLF